jgi:hypothetical protein
MAIYQNNLWGYTLHYPDDWIHRSLEGAEGFAVHRQALDPDYAGPQAGHLLMQAEWNGLQVPIEPIWKSHIGKLAGIIGAKQLGSATWHMGGAKGLEADIALPKKSNMRLWAGVLVKDLLVLKCMVAHPREEREHFEPIATEILKSLQFPQKMPDLTFTPEGLPLPLHCEPTDPEQVLRDLTDPERWKAYRTDHPLGGLQAFYYREAPMAGWTLEEFLPLPGNHDLPFARLRLRKERTLIGMELIPHAGPVPESEPRAHIAFTVRNPI